MTIHRSSTNAMKPSNDPTEDCALGDIDDAVKSDEKGRLSIDGYIRNSLESVNTMRTGSILNIRNLLEGE